MRKWVPLALALAVVPCEAGVGHDGRQAPSLPATAVSVETLQLSRVAEPDATTAPVSPSYACALIGGSAAGLTALFGAEALLAEIVIAPVAPALLTVGLAGVAFVTFCNVGQALAPAATGLATRLGAPPDAPGGTGEARLATPPAPRLAPVLQRSARALDPAARLRRDGIEAAQQGCASSARCARLMELLGLAPHERPTPSVADVAPDR